MIAESAINTVRHVDGSIKKHHAGHGFRRGACSATARERVDERIVRFASG